MKSVLSSADWVVAFQRLSGATELLAELVNMLDRCDETEAACEEAKRIEMELCVLESQLRQARKRSESSTTLSSVNSQLTTTA
jgi:hypothetical protein